MGSKKDRRNKKRGAGDKNQPAVLGRILGDRPVYNMFELMHGIIKTGGFIPPTKVPGMLEKGLGVVDDPLIRAVYTLTR